MSVCVLLRRAPAACVFLAALDILHSILVTCVRLGPSSIPRVLVAATRRSTCGGRCTGQGRSSKGPTWTPTFGRPSTISSSTTPLCPRRLEGWRRFPFLGLCASLKLWFLSAFARLLTSRPTVLLRRFIQPLLSGSLAKPSSVLRLYGVSRDHRRAADVLPFGRRDSIRHPAQQPQDAPR